MGEPTTWSTPENLADNVLLASHDLGLPVLVAMKIVAALYKRLVCNVQILEAVKYQQLLERAL